MNKNINWDIIDMTIAFFLILSCLGGSIFCSYVFRYEIQEWWERPRVKTPTELSGSLTMNQVKCIKQVTQIENLIYVDDQKEPTGFLAIAYVASNEYKVAVFSVSEQLCQLEYNKTLYYEDYIYSTDFETIFMDIRWFDLTGDGRKDVYIWFNRYPDRWRGAVHIIDAKQVDNSYKNILHLTLCRDVGFIEFSDTKPVINIINYEICSNYIDDPPTGRTTYEILLMNDGSEIIKE